MVLTSSQPRSARHVYRALGLHEWLIRHVSANRATPFAMGIAFVAKTPQLERGEPCTSVRSMITARRAVVSDATSRSQASRAWRLCASKSPVTTTSGLSQIKAHPISKACRAKTPKPDSAEGRIETWREHVSLCLRSPLGSQWEQQAVQSSPHRSQRFRSTRAKHVTQARKCCAIVKRGGAQMSR